MPRYHFHSEDGRSYLDKDGVELSSDREAQIEAARVFGELLRDQPDEIWEAPARG